MSRLFREYDAGGPGGAARYAINSAAGEAAAPKAVSDRPRPLSITVDWLFRLLAPIDVAVLLSAAAGAYALTLATTPGAVYSPYMTASALGALLVVSFFNITGLYAPGIAEDRGRSMRRVAAGWTGTIATLTTIAFMARVSNDYAPTWVVAWFGLGLAGLLGVRLLLFAAIARQATAVRYGRQVAILGDDDLALQLADHFAAHPDRGVSVAGLFSGTANGRPGRRMDGDVNTLVARLREAPVDSVILAVRDPNDRQVEALCARLREVPVDVRLCPGPLAMQMIDKGVTHFAGVPTLDVIEKPLADWRASVKAVEDRVIGGAITLAISPLLLLIAAAIKLDSPGPVFFRQPRKGYNNQIIHVLKFRTMYVDRTDRDGNQLTTRNDARVTRLGGFLRRHSLDELPQFLNVLRGDMSIVGPRPHALSAKAGGWLYDEAVPHYDARHRVKPGITGWAQINGWRGPTETVRQIRKRVEYDEEYIERCSLWLDLKIILLTVFKGFRSENAF